MQVLDGAGAPRKKPSAWPIFSDLSSLEAWAEQHPTHLAIFNAFLETMAPLGPKMQLRLFHEVTALPPHSQSFEYVNCHTRTGLLAAV